MAYAAVSIPEFPVVAWLQSDASIRSRALAIVEGTAPLQRVVAINGAARRQGVTRGMSKVQAEASGALFCRQRCMEEETAAFENALKIAEQFSPRVQALASPNNQYAQAQALAALLLIDRSGTATLFGSAEQYARQLKDAFDAAKFPCSIATCPNADASLLFARSQRGIQAVELKDVAKRLAPLPLSLLPCDAATLAIFTRWGIRTLGALAALPEGALISRIGQQAKRLQQLANGIAEHLLVPEEPELVLSETAVLDTPLVLLESLLFVISPMLKRILRLAVERAYSLRSVAVRLHLEKAAPFERHIRPALATQNRELLLKLLNLDLQAHPPQAAILGVTITGETARPQTAQCGLFQPQFPEPEKTDILLARLRSIAGQDNVGSPKLRNSHRDDEVVMTEFRPSIDSSVSITSQLSYFALRRFRPPQPVRITLRHGTPLFLFWQGERLELAETKGPWQSNGYWWDGRTWETDEWDVVAVQPSYTLRLCYERREKSWSVAGVYD